VPILCDGATQLAEAPVPDTGSLGVLLEATDAQRTEALLGALRAATGGYARVDLRVRFLSADHEIRTALDRICGTAGWAEASTADLRKIAREMQSERLLTITDRVKLNGAEALGKLHELLELDPSAASASCVLLEESIIKRETVLQPASGGIFPAGVSFATSPRLRFNEPDVLQALAGLTYPVAANTLLFSLWRTRAVAELPSLTGPVPQITSDVRLGLDLIDAGFQNLCTTCVSARLSGPYRRRDCIDPDGSSHLQPDRWANILSRVTILRELF
jgi:hypothetical protein